MLNLTLFERWFPWWPQKLGLPHRHGQTHERTLGDYPHRGSQERQYRVYTPSRYKAKKQWPVVMVLHGCLQNHHDMQVITEWDTVAELHQFIVIYPFVTQYHDLRGKNCWGWWRHDHIRPGMGEVEDIKCLLSEVSDEFSIDAQRCYIAGLSSGAGMTVAALICHPGLFAAGASVAGVPYGETPRAVNLPYTTTRYQPNEKILAKMAKVRGDDREPAPLMIIQSHDDDTVGSQAAMNLRDTWVTFFGLGELTRNIFYGNTHGTPWEHSRHIDQNGKSHLETLFLNGPDHGWYGGKPGEFSFPDAPHASRLIWAFFQQHQLPKTKPRETV